MKTNPSMDIPDQLRCLFTGQIEERDGKYVIEVPEQELQLGDLAARETYRVAILPGPTGQDTSTEQAETDSEPEPRPDRGSQSPPVTEGETRNVEIEDIGEQGDGITRVERGYVVIVPDTEMGERVTVEIKDVQQNVAFAEVVERLSYYD